MADAGSPAPASVNPKAMTIAGWVLTVLPALMLLASAGGKIARVQPVLEGFPKLGWPEPLARPIGVLELACVLAYLLPRTGALGAILITGYMGGAIATHVRLGEGWYLQAGLGVAVWLGLWLRDVRVRAILPLR